MKQQQQTLVDRVFLEKLERLTIHAQRSFAGLLGGHDASRFAGAGQEFLDHRNFHAGDDLRAVNWRAYMRFERFFLKTFEMEPRVPIRILLDCSQSMLAGSPKDGTTKFLYAQRLAAALVYIGLVGLDSMTLLPFAAGLREPCTATGGRHQFQPAEAFLRGLMPDGVTDFPLVARQFLGSYAQRGLAVVISDFLDDGSCVRALQWIADRGHEPVLFHLWAAEDREPRSGSGFQLVDSETGETMTVVNGLDAQKAYTRAFDEHAEDLRRLALRNGGRYAGVCIDTDLDSLLFGPLIMPLEAAR